MAAMTWRNRYRGRSGLVIAVVMTAAAVSMLAMARVRESCDCPPQQRDHPWMGDRAFEVGLFPYADRDIYRNAGQDAGRGAGVGGAIVSTTTSWEAQQPRTIFKDLQPENDGQVYETEDEGDPGMPDIMSNLSLADIKHMTWGESLDVKAFLAWSEHHVNSNASSRFVQPELVMKAEMACTSETELLVLMPSVPEHVFVRELVRQTWAGSLYGMPWPRRRLHLKTSLVFVIGTYGLAENKVELLKEESQDYDDLVTADFVDSYRNLTLKMLTGLDWVARYCPSASYILKCDLDTFVNLPLMTRLLASVGEKLPRFVFGGRHESLNPPVLRSGKWAITKEEYPFPVFPPYVMGHSYVLTAGLAPQMVRLAHKIPMVPSEDSFITGVLACILKATRLYHEAFASNFKRPLPCNIVFNEDVSMTKMGMANLLLMWRHVLTNSCSARELPPRANMAIQPGKKKQQQPPLLKQDPSQKKQPQQQQNLQKEVLQEEWKNPLQNIHTNQQQQQQQQNQEQQQQQQQQNQEQQQQQQQQQQQRQQQKREQQQQQWQNPPEENQQQIQYSQRHPDIQKPAYKNQQQYQNNILQEELENPWQIPDFGSWPKQQQPHHHQQNLPHYQNFKNQKQNDAYQEMDGKQGEADRREQKKMEEEEKMLQQLFQ